MARKPQRLAVYQVDAFTDRPFRGNPAAVVPLDSWLPAPLMQRIAAEINLSETAFLVPAAQPPGRQTRNKPAGGTGARGQDTARRYRLRWFTPRVEVPLCGHATLASAYIVMTRLQPDTKRIVFDTRSGPLTVERLGSRRAAPLLQLDFPALPPRQAGARLAARVAAAIGVQPLEVWQAVKLMAVLPDSRCVRSVRPDFDAVKALPAQGLIITAPAARSDRPADFVSRYFAPHAGVDEDPVTGSAHCTLVPYWAQRLGKTELHARQVSARGGDLMCRLAGERVTMAGYAVPFMSGTIHVR